MRKRTKTAVRAAYTFDNLQGDILRQRNALDAKGRKQSYRTIAKKYGVNHAVIHRIVVYGIEPKDHKIRHALGLSDYVQVQTCSKCGQLHAFSRRCPGAVTKYPPHPVMRLSRLKAILNSPYRDS